ncbi:branched chain amino acid ABC transporter ATP-binding protein [Desulfoluna limicola]|uniref:Branched chain amino acid ABC transporter ATP-binding protein n=1 Tax=Desulfoluna limicola TaxID=2810562 RepID=A0ABN6F3K6_9BACT|nr:ABC transporter ATP-binding protein [Desulfoluna limicola]BCS95872.1 branched chain amino acid ABC transporter ATP-binding protein [Desulfoluna limicola]
MKQPAEAVIALEGISKSFGKVHANKEIRLTIRKGTVKALLGENGAGKSTLMSILAGRLQPDAGRIVVDGKAMRFGSAKDAIEAGIGMVYQHFKLVESMTVAENVFLGQEGGQILKPRVMEATVKELALSHRLDIDPAARVADLSMGEKQRVEILKLLQRKSRILIFDEPTAVLTPQEGEQLFKALVHMAEQGKSIVFISHKLGEVMRVADEVAILRKGEIIEEKCISDVTSQDELARMMVGKETFLEVVKHKVEEGAVVLDVRDLAGNGLKGVSLDVKRGEILGIVGVAGNGQKPLVETICGLQAPEKGAITILGKTWKSFFSRRKTRETLSYIPEDRIGLATCPSMNLSDNFLLTTRKGFRRGPWLRRKRVERESQNVVDRFSVLPGHLSSQARHLSGGNLQKLVLGREFFRNPGLIVAEQPTQGLDIATAKLIWDHLVSARDNAGILLVTGDLNEAFALADRVAVMFEGAIVDVFDVADTEKRERVGLMMAGAA